MNEELLLSIMESAAGRSFLWTLLEGSGVDTGAFSTDPCQNAFLAGRASIGVELLNVLRRSERGAELEYIMRRECRHPPDDQEEEEDFYKQFKEGEE